MNEPQTNPLDDDQPTDVGQAQADWLRSVMRREIRLQVSAPAGPEDHDPRILDVDASEVAMGC
jgi:hypothetical protein